MYYLISKTTENALNILMPFNISPLTSYEEATYC